MSQTEERLFSAESDPAERWCELADELIAFLKPRTKSPQDAFALLEFMLDCHRDGEIGKLWY